MRGGKVRGSMESIDGYWPALGRTEAANSDQIRPQGGARGPHNTHTKHVKKISTHILWKIVLLSVAGLLGIYCIEHSTIFEVINATLLTFHAHFHLAREES